MFSVVEISECPSASWMTFIFTPASHILVVNVCLGHSDVSTTMHIYAHSTRKAKRDSARLLDKVASNA